MIADKDIKALFRGYSSQSSSPLATPEIPLPPPYLELLSGTGIILERSAKEEIETRVIRDISHERPRTSIVQLASELSLESRTIERLLPYHREGWGRIGASTIVTTGEFKRLSGDLSRELLNGVVQVAEFCRRNEIDTDLFRKLLPPVAGEGTWQWLGHDRTWVVGTAFYKAKERDIQKSLIDEKRPVDMPAIVADSNLPSIFLKTVVSTLIKSQGLNGIIEGGYYVPEAYVVQRQNSIADDLRRDGFIATETLRKEGIEAPEEFIRDKVPSARLLGAHFVTADFIASVEGSILEHIERQMWSDLKDLDLRLNAADEKLLRQVIVKDLPELREITERIVSKDLEPILTEACHEFAVQQAEVAWKKRSKDKDVSFRSQELFKHLAAKNESLPTPLLSYFVNALYPQASLAFSVRLRELKDSEIRIAEGVFVERCYTRFRLHHLGLEALVDASLKTKLASDLLEYAKGMISSSLDKLESALIHSGKPLDLQQLRLVIRAESAKPQLALKGIENGLIKLIQQDLAFELPSDNELGKRKRGMLDEMQLQLEATKDPSLMLLLTTIILHSSKASGILKSTGKYVPKLLKDLGKRDQIAEVDLEVLSSAKDAVIGRKNIGEKEAEQLRQIAKRYLVGTELRLD
ncbi:hypothetical protein DFP73DRAFT_383338 [Morchella snyderi]|nr:hypothetical protein DFP73DRAFT_383338 [Morchella snyderi]